MHTSSFWVCSWPNSKPVNPARFNLQRNFWLLSNSRKQDGNSYNSHPSHGWKKSPWTSKVNSLLILPWPDYVEVFWSTTMSLPLICRSIFDPATGFNRLELAWDLWGKGFKHHKMWSWTCSQVKLRKFFKELPDSHCQHLVFVEFSKPHRKVSLICVFVTDRIYV